MSDSPASSSASQETEKVAELMRGIKFALLTTVEPDGTCIARPMAHQDVEFDGDLWFVSSRNARKVDQIAANPRVGVTFSSTRSWVSVSGTAAVVEDLDKLKEVWSTDMDAWFPQGPDDSLVLIKVTGDAAEYWDGPGGRVSTALSLVKTKVTGQRYDANDHDTVDLQSAG
jgi:general stress protein 26